MKIRRGMQTSGIVVIFIEMHPAQQYAFLLFNKFSDMYFFTHKGFVYTRKRFFVTCYSGRNKTVHKQVEENYENSSC